MTDPQILDWGQLVGFIRGEDSRDRARAMWHACGEVLSNLQSYYPIRFASLPPALEGVSLSEIVSHSARADAEASQTGRNVVKAFASWRTHITEVEAQNAARLHMLASTLRTLADLHSKSTQPELVLTRIAELGRFIEAAWAVPVPLSTGDIRGWAQRLTRRYDLLSAEWREL